MTNGDKHHVHAPSVRDYLCVLALDEHELVAFVRQFDRHAAYQLDHDGLTVATPLEAMSYLARRRFEFAADADDAEFAGLMVELSALLLAMFESHYDYLWYVDKGATPVGGPADKLWRLVRRLARQALAARGWVRSSAANSVAEAVRLRQVKPPHNPPLERTV